MIRFLWILSAVGIMTHGLYGQTPAGPWAGRWVSDAKGHNGPLKADLRQIDDETYRATFRGRFAGIIPFWYRTTLHVDSVGDGVTTLSARQRLPFVGEYRTNATVTATTFDAQFHSRRESGRFVMSRR